MYLISGSVAYDTILSHKGKFHHRILPEALNKLNVAFGVDAGDDQFGGTAGNIAYNASLLGQSPLVCSNVGRDFSRYEKHWESRNISTQGLNLIEDELTAHAWLLTDSDNNQITAFNKGALRHKPNIPSISPEIWHLAPEEIRNTCLFAKKAIEEKKTYFFDPGQSIGGFLEKHNEHIISLKDILHNATGLFVNEYESQMLQEALKKTPPEFLQGNMQFVVQTLGSKGLNIYLKDEIISLDVAKPNKITDPTGCGDALRAGFIYGYTHQWSLEDCAKLGAVMGSFAIEEHGAQKHTPSLEEIFKRLNTTYGLSKTIHKRKLP